MLKLSLLMPKNKTVITTAALILASYLLSATVFLLWPAAGDFLNHSGQDLLFKLRSLITTPQRRPSQLLIVPLDDTFMSTNSVSAWERTLFARFIDNLSRNEAGIIAFDMIFTQKLPELCLPQKDAELIRAGKEAANVYYPVYLQPVQQQYRNAQLVEELVIRHPHIINRGSIPELQSLQTSFPQLQLSARGSGHINLMSDSDGKFRKYPLLIKHDDGYVLSFPLAILCGYLEVKPEDILVEAGRYLTLPNALFYGHISRDIKIPIDNAGNLLLNYTSTWEDSFFYLDPARLTKDQKQPDSEIFKLVHNSIVLIADLTTSGKDYIPGILQPVYPSSSLLALVMASILDEKFISEGAGWEIALFWGLLSLLLGWCSFKFRPGVFFLSLLLLWLAAVIWQLSLFIIFNKVMPAAPAWSSFFLAALAVTVSKLLVNDRETALGIITKLDSRLREKTPPVVNQEKAGSIEDRLQQHNLTPRQKEVVRLTCEGFESGEVAYRLNISRRTVDNHLRIIYDKTGTHNKLSLMKLIYAKHTTGAKAP